jgi:hypothetical protein
LDVLTRKKTLIVLAKAVLFFAGFQLLLVLSLAIGFAIEKEFFWNPDTHVFSLVNHRNLAWTGLFLTLIGLPVAGILGRHATRKFSPSFYFLNDSWIGCVIGFLYGVFFILVCFSLFFLAGYARFTALPDRLLPQELVASLLAYCLIMLLIGFNNELVYRGILVCEWAFLWKNRIAGVAAGSVVYGLMRAWSGRGPVPERLILFVSGIIFSWFIAGIMFHKKSLKYAVGVHAGYYFGLSALLGSSSGGNRLNITPFITDIQGPYAVSGGTLGMENSLIFNGILLVLTAIIWSRHKTGAQTATRFDGRRTSEQ